MMRQTLKMTVYHQELHKEYQQKEAEGEEEHKNKDVYVLDTFITNLEQEALSSAIYLLGEKMENTYDDKWIDSEKLEHEETMKHLCRLYGRYSNRNGRKLI